jgi:DNA modification methylase
MCGDSTNEADVAKLMDGEKADMVFTDPPYGYSYDSNHQKVNKHKMLKNDDKILDFWVPLKKAMHKNSSVFICGSFQTIFKWFDKFDENFNFKNMIVWKKNNWSMGDLKGAFAGQHEIILFGHKGKVNLIGNRDSDIWEFDRVPPKLHPTMKPIALIEYAISKVPSKKVLDLFLGSGSTLIACEKTNRRCYGMEVDAKYINVILKRFEQYSGDSVELIEK